jgi:hypothetical protein
VRLPGCVPVPPGGGALFAGSNEGTLGSVETVTGGIEIAAMTRHEGFKWIKRKHHYPRDLNVEGTLP